MTAVWPSSVNIAVKMHPGEHLSTVFHVLYGKPAPKGLPPNISARKKSSSPVLTGDAKGLSGNMLHLFSGLRR